MNSASTSDDNVPLRSSANGKLHSSSFVLKLAPEAKLIESAAAVRIELPWRQWSLDHPPSCVATALQLLADTGECESRLCQLVHDHDGDSGVLYLYGVLHALGQAGAIRRSLLVDEKCWATWTGAASGPHFESVLPTSQTTFRLSRFASLRADGNATRMESPLGRAELLLQHSDAVSVVAALLEPRTLRELEDLFPVLSMEAMTRLLLMLFNSGALAADEESSATGEPTNGPLAAWEFHDLLFHMRSRAGRHRFPYGGTFRQRQLKPPHLVREPFPGEAIPLPSIDLERLNKIDPPFSHVVEQRRSVREYSDEPLALEDLAEFLYRSSRIQRVLPGDVTDYAFRPTPAGGALHELEVYPIVVSCRGLEAGVYHYCPHSHLLRRVAAPSEKTERLLQLAWQTGDRGSPIQVYLAITARCQRVYWKYESMGYALILKNLGALYATMYLTATAIGLAPCALGGGNADLFCQIASLDPYEEPQVGEFLLGACKGPRNV